MPEKQKPFLQFNAKYKTLAKITKTRMITYLFTLGFIALSIVSVIWVTNFLDSLQKYEEYCETVKEQGLDLPVPYHAWDSGRYVNITLIALFFLWIPFIDHSLRKILYPFLRQKLTYREAKTFSRSVSRTLYEDVYVIVLGYFTRIWKKLRDKNMIKMRLTVNGSIYCEPIFEDEKFLPKKRMRKRFLTEIRKGKGCFLR